jgi:hypothetical protein
MVKIVEVRYRMDRLPSFRSREQLCRLIEDVGFMPLFSGVIPGFSVQELSQNCAWWSGNTETDPWEWRKTICAEGKIAYGKIFSKKAGYISRRWYPLFASNRRRGYDFDTLYEVGLASRRSKLIYDQLLNGNMVPSYELRRLAQFGKEGEKGFEGVLTTLQMQTYITIRGFERKLSKTGEEYGWPASIYSTSEDLFGEYVRSAYEVEPDEAKEQIMSHLLEILPSVEKSLAEIFLKA